MSQAVATVEATPTLEQVAYKTWCTARVGRQCARSNMRTLANHHMLTLRLLQHPNENITRLASHAADDINRILTETIGE